jgi:hypothetical protein
MIIGGEEKVTTKKWKEKWTRDFLTVRERFEMQTQKEK